MCQHKGVLEVLYERTIHCVFVTERKEVFKQTKDQDKVHVTDVLIEELSRAIVSFPFTSHLAAVPCVSHNPCDNIEMCAIRKCFVSA